MNQEAAQLARWLLAANGALKNVAQLLTESFAPQPVAAATIDPATITAYPVDPGAVPIGDHWSRGENGWVHPLHSALLPRSTTASHHVVAGVTSRNELLLINLAAAAYLGIEGADPVPLLRSWLIQVLSTTPEAQICVDDPNLAIPAAPRLDLVAGPAATPPGATALFAVGHTSGPAAPITVSGQAASAANVVLCSGPAAGIYIANRYWPMWRRMELTDQQWTPIAAALTAAAKTVSSADATSPGRGEEVAEQPAAAADLRRCDVDEPAPTSADATSPLSPAASGAAAPATEIAPSAAPVEDRPTPAPITGPSVPAAPPVAVPLLAEPGLEEPEPELEPTAERVQAGLPGPPRPEEPPTRGLFALGETYAAGVDPDTGAPVTHPAVTRQGVRKPIKALMMLATSSGLTTAEWDKELQFNPPNRRQARTTIRKLMGGTDPIREDARGLLVTDLYCDWKEFQRLAGPIPSQASTENLIAAVALIRGAPFEDIPPGDYGWRSAELLKDELLDRCSDAALELARRQHAAGASTSAYQTARLGIRVYPEREDLWEIALAAASDDDRPGLLYDLKQAIPAPRTPELRQLLAEARSR